MQVFTKIGQKKGTTFQLEFARTGSHVIKSYHLVTHLCERYINVKRQFFRYLAHRRAETFSVHSNDYISIFCDIFHKFF